MKIRIKTYNGELNDLTVGKNYEITNDFGDGDLGVFIYKAMIGAAP